MMDTESPATDAVRLLSYNIRYAGLDTGTYSWEQRRDGVASVIRFHRPDLVTLQEVWMTQLDDLRERLSSLEWVGKRILDLVGLTDWEVFVLSDTPEEYDMLGWEATLPRLTTEVSFQDTDTGKIHTTV